MPSHASRLDTTAILAGLSHALDLTEGHPRGHAERSAAIGLRIADAIALPEHARAELLHATLLKDAGCSSNAARVYEVFGGSDHDVKRALWERDWRRPSEQVLYALQWAGRGGSPFARVRRLASLAAMGPNGGREMFQIRCARGAEIARRVGCGESVAQAIHDMDEHWDGGGHPRGLRGESIPLVARVMGLAQVMEIFYGDGGPALALAVARDRAGRWFDPELVHALVDLESDERFWASLSEPGLSARLSDYVPASGTLPLTETSIDAVAEAFALIIDGKSPYTYQHSRRVADYAVSIGARLGLPHNHLVRLRREALVHDLGKLTVPNAILDKPAALTADEWQVMRRHPAFTYDILVRVPVFSQLALDAASHHERPDGRGYHRGVGAPALSLDAQILAVSDVMDALAADRPYRAGMPPDRVLALLREGEGTQFSSVCIGACTVDLIQARFTEPSASPEPVTA